MACTYTYNGKEYTLEEVNALVEKGEFDGLVGVTLPPYETDGKIDVAKTVTKYLDEAVRNRQGIRKNAAKGYYYANQKPQGKNSYFQAMQTIKKINRIFGMPVLGSPKRIQTATGIKYTIPILKDNIIKVQGAFDTAGMFEYDDLIVAGKSSVKYEALAETYKTQKTELYKKLSQQYNKKKAARAEKDAVLVKKIDARIEEIKELIDRLDSRLKDLKKVTSLEGLLDFAEDHLQEVKAIFDSGDLNIDSIAYVQRIIRLWQKAGDFDLKNEPHIFFTDSELDSEILKYGGSNAAGEWINGFAFYKQQMDHYAGLLAEFQQERVTEFVQKYTGEKMATVDIYKAITDASEFAANLLSLAETKDPMLQALAIAIKKQTTKARNDTTKINERIDELVTRIHPKLRAIGGKDIYGIFKQKDKDGKETGDMVMRYSVEYYDKKDELARIADSTGKARDWDRYFSWRRANEIMFDVRKLFPRVRKGGTYVYRDETFTKDQVDAHKEELKRALGEAGYNKMMARLETKIEEFELDYQLAKERIYDNPETTDAEKAALLDQWDKVNSPYWAVARIVDVKKVVGADGKKVRVQGQNRTYSVPKKYRKDGSKTGWYDPNFEVIEKDADLMEFYEFALETMYQLNNMLPHDVKKNIRINTVPAVKKTLMEKFGSDKSGKMAAIGVWDNMMEVLRSSDISEINTVSPDPVTEQQEKNLKFHLLSNHRKEFEDRLKTALIRHEAVNGKMATVKEKKAIEKDILHDMAQKKSFDLGKILKLYAFTVYSFHHKSVIEDFVKLIEQQFYERKEALTNASGNILYTKDGAVATKEGLTNYKEMLDFALRRFYNLKEQDVEMKSKQKLYTAEERERKAGLEATLVELKKALDDKKISPSVYDDRVADVQTQLDELGGVLTGSGVANGAIRWMQLKSLGWNVLAGIANMGFGVVSNIVEAGDGRLYNMEHYKKAMRMVLDSILRNFSFNSVTTPTAKKIRALMDRLDVLKDASDEMYKATSRSLVGANKLRFLDPYQMQKRSEYLNQAPVMIAIMLNPKYGITDREGNMRPMWEAFDDNGHWKTKEFGPEPTEFIEDAKVRIDQAIKKTHGNYDPDSPLKVKKKALGRLAAQFRTWMFEGFFNRFGKEYKDYSLGYIRKGRYRSGFASISYATGTGLSWSEQSLLMTRELARRIFFGHLFKKAERNGTFMGKEYEFSEVDYANLSANINELLLYVTATIVLAALKNAAKGDDDDNFAFNVLINELLRVQTDIAFYSNPSSMEALLKRPIPAMSLMSDTGQLLSATWRMMLGDDEIGSGVYAGDSRLFREAVQFLPFTTQAHKVYSSGVQVFDK